MALQYWLQLGYSMDAQEYNFSVEIIHHTIVSNKIYTSLAQKREIVNTTCWLAVVMPSYLMRGVRYQVPACGQTPAGDWMSAIANTHRNVCRNPKSSVSDGEL